MRFDSFRFLFLKVSKGTNLKSKSRSIPQCRSLVCATYVNDISYNIYINNISIIRLNHPQVNMLSR